MKPCEYTTIYGTDKTFEVHGGEIICEVKDGKVHIKSNNGLHLDKTEG